MPRQFTPLAICYDFDGTLSPGSMQNYNFIPALGVKPSVFWDEVKRLAREQQGDDVLIYMGHMLHKADGAGVQVSKAAFRNMGATVELFRGVRSWFERIGDYEKRRKIRVEHFIISSGLREMIEGTPIAGKLTAIFASGFWYDHNGVARFPAIGINYTTKTQYLFRINKGSLDVWDHQRINAYVPPEDRPIPFRNMIFVGDGEKDIPCFRLVKDQGGHSIAVYRPGARNGGKGKVHQLIVDGRVNFVVPADYSPGSPIEKLVKGVIDKIASDASLKQLGGKW